jgi:uncharacterized protein (TIGR02270 family)
MIDFAWNIYLEHLEEASFLYEQRLTLFDDPEITWLDIEDFEDRFEPHIDGLVVGEELALEVCREQAIEGDFGELHAAVRVFCRQKRLELLQEVVDKLDPEDEESIQAICDALRYELPVEWEGEFVQKLMGDSPVLMQVVTKLIGYRRINNADTLLQTLQNCNLETSISVVWALGRLREQKARVPLFNGYLQSGDESVRSAAALTLLRIGEPQAVTYCLCQAPTQNWPLLSIGLGGSQSAVPVLLEKAAKEASFDCLISLGLLGDVKAIESLLARLTSAEFAEPAAMALNLITGAELYEEVFIPDEIDEDELFEEELEKYRQGEAPARPDGEPFGITITRISEKPEDWHNWWKENKSRFDSKIRYRNGKAYSPACLLENLESEKSPHRVRQLAYEEFVIRYGIDFPFETDMFVTDQKQALAKYTEWIEANASQFKPGKWYFAGQLCRK